MSASAGPGQLLGSLLPLALLGTSIHRAVQVGRLGQVALVTATVGTLLTAGDGGARRSCVQTIKDPLPTIRERAFGLHLRGSGGRI